MTLKPKSQFIHCPAKRIVTSNHALASVTGTTEQNRTHTHNQTNVELKEHHQNPLQSKTTHPHREEVEKSPLLSPVFRMFSSIKCNQCSS